MTKFIYQQRLTRLTTLALIILIYTTVFCQSKIQKRIIIENEHNYSLVKAPTFNNLVVKKSRHNNESALFYSPALDYHSLENNPIPWYIRDSTLYYVYVDRVFKGFCSLVISAVDLNTFRSIKNFDVMAIKEAELNAQYHYFLSEMHNRGFNNDDLLNLYYDFTVTENGTVILVSYYKNTVCTYQSITNMQYLDFCGCTKQALDTPFQVFESEGKLLIKGSLNNYHIINIDKNGSIEIFETESKSREKQKDDYLIIDND